MLFLPGSQVTTKPVLQSSFGAQCDMRANISTDENYNIKIYDEDIEVQSIDDDEFMDEDFDPTLCDEDIQERYVFSFTIHYLSRLKLYWHIAFFMHIWGFRTLEFTRRGWLRAVTFPGKRMLESLRISREGDYFYEFPGVLGSFHTKIPKEVVCFREIPTE